MRERPAEAGKETPRPHISRLFSMRPNRSLLVFAVLDLVFFGMGMGVPIFCIVFGFVVGWFAARSVTATSSSPGEVLGRILRHAVVTSSFTFMVMAVAWGRTAALLWDPKADFEGFGIPMILFDPRMSFIGWLVLMILISPLLQLLTTIFGSYVTLLSWSRRNACRPLK